MPTSEPLEHARQRVSVPLTAVPGIVPFGLFLGGTSDSEHSAARWTLTPWLGTQGRAGAAVQMQRSASCGQGERCLTAFN